MVRTLEETWRVLRKSGILIDLRPLHSNVTIHLVRKTDTILLTRHTDDWRHTNDEAANAAIHHIIGDGRFVFEKSAAFEYVKFYDTGQELLDYYAARHPPVEQTEDVIQQIKRADGNPDITLRVGNPMVLNTYRRT